MPWGAGSPWGVVSWGIGSATVTGADGTVSTVGADELNRLFGEDILFDGDFHETQYGDYVVISGLPALKQRIFLRLLTRPGEFKARPGYGVGVQEWVKKRNRPTELKELERRLIDQLSLERGVDEVTGVAVENIPDVEGIRINVGIRVANITLRFKPLTLTQEVFGASGQL